MKTIYLIRHGESEGNAGPLRQVYSTELTERGRAQAAFMAERCARLQIDLLISSPMTRARQTAESISEKIGREIHESSLFEERRRPSAQNGQPKDDPKIMQIDREIYENFAKPGYRHSDEENFEDLRERAKRALAFLSERPEEHIAVVTHKIFIQILMAMVVFRDALTGSECELFLRAFHMENTGLSVFTYTPENKEVPWSVRVWNDHVHLG